MGDEVATLDGFLTITLADGWEATEIDEVNRTIDSIDEEWRVSQDSVDSLLALENGDSELLIARDGRFVTNPGVSEYNRELLAFVGGSPTIELNSSVLGDPGHRSSASPGNRRLDTAQVDGQYIAALAILGDAEGSSAEIDAMLATIVVDTSVIAPLAHAVDTQFANNTDGVETFLVGVLAPASWAQDDEPTRYYAPDGEHFIAHVGYGAADGDTFDSFVDNERTTFANDWLDVDPIIEERTFNEMPYRVFWEGPAESAEAAIVMGFDGAFFHAAYIYTGDNALLIEMVDSVFVSTSALTPAGG